MTTVIQNLKKHIVLVFIFILLIVISLFVAHFKKGSLSQSELNTFVVEKMTACDPSDLNCFKDLAHTLATENNMKDILKVFETNEQQSVFFASCHTTLHFLGQEEYKMTQDTSKSLSTGTPICFAGFYHGILEAYLTDSGIANNPDELAKAVPTLCKQDDFSEKKTYNECLHGLGHALMYATNSDLPASLKLCDTLRTDSDRQWCYSGSFMENSTSSTNKDHPSKYLKKEDPLYPCDILDHKYGNMCYTLQSFYFAELSNYDLKKNEALCYKVPAEFQDGCFNAIGQNQVGATQDPKKMLASCSLLSESKNRTQCLNGVIGGIGERYDDGWKKVLDFCNNTLNDPGDKNSCYDRAMDLSRNWISDPGTLREFCEEIGVQSKKDSCLQRVQ